MRILSIWNIPKSGLGLLNRVKVQITKLRLLKPNFDFEVFTGNQLCPL